MPHFILRYRGPGSVQPEHVNRISSLPNTAILDSSSDRMILVDAPEAQLRATLKEMPGWTMIPEETVPLPDHRKKILRPPADAEDEGHS
ncbi:MAG TPA: hypothetical protein VEK85_03155 [Gemmatimonadales bacterium]|nr:hypothetical protein [Gemmatimonadales bacterium]